MYLRFALTTLIAATATAADDGKIGDLRLSATAMGDRGYTDFTWRNTGNGATVSSGVNTFEADRHGRMALTYITGEAKPTGMIVGVGLALDRAEYDWANGNTESWQGAIVDLDIGVAVTLSENLHLEAAGVFGSGYGQVDISGPGLTTDPAIAYIMDWGLRVGVYGTVSQLQLGLETGWMSTGYYGATWTGAGAGMNISEDTVFSGLVFGLSLGYRL